MKKFACVMICLMLMTAGTTVYSEDAKEITGTIESIDTGTSVVVVKRMVDEAAGIAEYTMVVVSPETSLDNNGAAIQFSALAAGQNISVKYTANEAGENLASSVSVKQ